MLTIKHMKALLAQPDLSDDMIVIVENERSGWVGEPISARIDAAGQLVLTLPENDKGN